MCVCVFVFVCVCVFVRHVQCAARRREADRRRPSRSHQRQETDRNSSGRRGRRKRFTNTEIHATNGHCAYIDAIQSFV